MLRRNGCSLAAFGVLAALFVFVGCKSDDDGGCFAEENPCSPKQVCYATNFEGNATCVPLHTFAPCATNSECPGPNGVCYAIAEGYKAGFCSRPESVAGGCGPSSFSVAGDESAGTAVGEVFNGQSVSLGGSVCAPACRVSSDCAPGFACETKSRTAAYVVAETGRAAIDTRACVVHCSNDEPCAAGSCNPYTHTCAAVDSSLQDDGQACDLATDCRSGWCLADKSGFLDGLCTSPCVQPAASAYDADSLPSSDCPSSEVCAPDPEGAPAVLTQCRHRCTGDSDCRADYVCIHVAKGNGAPSTEGFCGIRLDPLKPE